jgi:hypothetical protein
MRHGFFTMLLACVALASCGSDITYWKIESSSLSFGSECSDAPSFRSSVHSPGLSPNTYLTYRTSADGKTATAMDCTTTDPSSCKEQVPSMVFTFDGGTASYTAPAEKQALGLGKCNLQATQQWSFTPDGSTISGKVDILFDLVDDASACQTYEDSLKVSSPNGKGIKGCVVTLSFDGTEG